MKTLKNIVCVVIFLISFAAFVVYVCFVIFDRWFVVRLMLFMFFGAVMLVTGKLLPDSVKQNVKPVLQIMMIAGIGMCVYGIVLIVQFIRDMDFIGLIKGGMMIVYGVGIVMIGGGAQTNDL